VYVLLLILLNTCKNLPAGRQAGNSNYFYGSSHPGRFFIVYGKTPKI
jgi:hypothetical protein